MKSRRLGFSTSLVVALGILASTASYGQNGPHSAERQAEQKKRSRDPQPPRAITRPPTTNKESAQLRQQARAALRSGNMNEVSRIMEIARRIRLRGEREAWQVFEAEVHVVRKEYESAGLAAMRLVILSPKSPHVGEALFWAAKAYEGLNRPTKAADLYRECIAHKSSNENTIRRARAVLGPLTTQKAGGNDQPGEKNP